MLRAFDKWLIPWFLQRIKRQNLPARPHVMLCVADHFEPLHDTNSSGAIERLDLWAQSWPKICHQFQDADGVPPRHTMFYPIEQYQQDHLIRLEHICRQTGAETEVHLHHSNDTADSLRTRLLKGKDDLMQHGFLSRKADGSGIYGFIHGDWALDDSHPQGLNCGVRGELKVLKETGCYADFTMPSAPHPTQTRIINSLYYARNTLHGKSHDSGLPVTAGETSHLREDPEQLLLVQGILGLNLGRRKWGLIPRIENSDLTRANPPTPGRFNLWLRHHIHVVHRPEWLFIKLHTHGAPPPNNQMLLGPQYEEFHRHLAEHKDDFHLHYVTAREFVNILHAAEDKLPGDPGQYRNYLYSPPPTQETSGV